MGIPEHGIHCNNNIDHAADRHADHSYADQAKLAEIWLQERYRLRNKLWWLVGVGRYQSNYSDCTKMRSKVTSLRGRQEWGYKSLYDCEMQTKSFDERAETQHHTCTKGGTG